MGQPTRPVRIALIDQHEILRIGLQRVLADANITGSVLHADSVQEGIDILNHEPCIALIDCQLRERIQLARSKEIGTRQKTLIIDMSSEPSLVQALRSLVNGASGWISKSAMPNDFLQAIEEVMRGHIYFGNVRWYGSDRPPQKSGILDQLTGRELQICLLLTQGKSNKDIARRLNISRNTVRVGMTTILEKLEARNRVEAAIKFAFELANAPRYE